VAGSVGEGRGVDAAIADDDGVAVGRRIIAD